MSPRATLPPRAEKWAERAVMALGMGGAAAFGITLGWVFVWWAGIVTLFSFGMALIFIDRDTSDSTEQGANPEPQQRDIGPE